MDHRPSYPGKVNTLDDIQHYALKRVRSIIEDHIKEKFSDPSKCKTFNEIYDLCIEYFKNNKAL